MPLVVHIQVKFSLLVKIKKHTYATATQAKQKAKTKPKKLQMYKKMNIKKNKCIYTVELVLAKNKLNCLS
jgi:hypothetical protein